MKVKGESERLGPVIVTVNGDSDWVGGPGVVTVTGDIEWICTCALKIEMKTCKLPLPNNDNEKSSAALQCP